jgi:hypothetical protein
MYRSVSCPAFSDICIRIIRAIPTPDLLDASVDLKFLPVVVHHNFENRILHKSKETTPYDTVSPASAASQKSPTAALKRDE